MLEVSLKIAYNVDGLPEAVELSDTSGLAAIKNTILF
jgi:hypothetical protein